MSDNLELFIPITTLSVLIPFAAIVWFTSAKDVELKRIEMQAQQIRLDTLKFMYSEGIK